MGWDEENVYINWRSTWKCNYTAGMMCGQGQDSVIQSNTMETSICPYHFPVFYNWTQITKKHTVMSDLQINTKSTECVVPVCVRQCRWSSSDRVNRLPQVCHSHTYGLSPECHLDIIINKLWTDNTVWQMQAKHARYSTDPKICFSACAVCGPCGVKVSHAIRAVGWLQWQQMVFHCRSTFTKCMNLACNICSAVMSNCGSWFG